MKKIFTLILFSFLITSYASAQIYVDENFDTGIPTEWTTTSEEVSQPWFWNDGTNYFQTIDSTGYARVDSDADGNGIHMVENLLTPEFDATAGNIIVLTFDHYYNDIGADFINIQVWDGTDWNIAYESDTDVGGWLNAFNGPPASETVIITDYVNPSGDTQIKFHYDDGNVWAWYWAIDNVVVQSVDCIEPQQVNVDQLGAINTLVSWTSGSGTSNLAFGPAGFDIDDIAGTGGTLVAPAASPYTISGLDPETNYEFYVQDDCGVDGMSSWAGPYAFTTTIGCPTPVFMNFSNPTTNTIDITFDQSFGNVHIIYGPQGFTPGSSGDTTDVVTSPFTLDGLDAITFYDVYLFMDCEGDGLGFSDNSGPWTFNTLVDGPGTSCADPIILNNNLPYDVIEQSICGYGDNLTVSPTPCGNWVSGYEEVVFAYAPETEDEVLGIFASNFTTNSTIYFEVSTMCPDSADAECVASGAWYSWDGSTTFFLDGVELTNGETYYITITGWTGAGCTLDLSIFLIDCVTPTGLTATSFTDGTAELSWTAGSDASNFQLEWGPVGFIPGEGTVVDGEYGVDGPPVTIDGLTSENNYEFYVIDICGFGSESIAAGPFEFSGPPPPNNLCDDAISIDCGDVVTGNTSSATTEGNPTEFCGTGLTANSVWYTFIGTGDDVTLDLCGSTYDTKVHLFTGDDCDNLICVGGNDDNFNCNVSGLHSYLYAPTVAGETYYVIVSGFSSNSGVFTLEYNCITCGLIDGLSVSVTDVTANVNWNNGNIDGEYVLEYGPAGFAQGTGTTLTGTVGTDGPPVLIDGLSPGLGYDVYVYELCTPTDSNQTLQTSFTTNLFPPPVNDQPCGALAIECGGTDTASTLYATDIGNPSGGLCGNDFNIMEGNTVWWSFVGTGQEVSISTCGSNFTTDLFIMSGSCDELECVVQSAYNSGPCGDWNSTEVSIAAEDGVTYWISVSPTGTWTSGGEVVLSIECIPCSSPTNIVASVTDVSANISWDSFNFPADFTLSWGPAGFDYPTDLGTVVTGNTADLPVLLEGLTADELYDVYIYEYCDTEDTNSDTVMTTFLTNAFPPPANDDICNAIDLETGVVLATTNLYSSTQLNEPVPPATGCQDPEQMGWCISSISNTTWYTYTPESDGMATISTCHPGSYDTQLAVYTGECTDLENLVLVGANDDQIGGCADAIFASTVAMCVEGGVTYYIQVDPYSSFGNGGDFSISVEFDAITIENVITFDIDDDVSIVWDYINDLGDEADFTLIYLNTTTGDTGSVIGNTANLPILIEGLENGQYEFYIYCTDDCNSSSGPEYFAITVGIDELSFGNNVNAYPNPTNDILNLEVNGELEKGTQIAILSLDGKIIYQEIINSTTTDYRGEIDLSNYARGVYVLKIEDSKSSIQEKIILQR